MIKFTLLFVFMNAALVCQLLHAAIPTIIGTNYTVSNSDACSGNCTVQSNCTLTVNNNAVATFNGNITVMPQAALIINGATIRMASGKRIVLRASLYGAPQEAAKMEVNNSLITSVGSNIFWGGIETMRGGQLYNNQGYNGESAFFSEHSIIENATVALKNYTTEEGMTMSGGRIWPMFTTFRDNIRSVEIFNENRAGAMTTPSWTYGMNWFITFQKCNFEYTQSFAPSPFPPDMVLILYSKGISFLTCNFIGNNFSTTNTTGIRAMGSGLKIHPYYQYYVGIDPDLRYNTPQKLDSMLRWKNHLNLHSYEQKNKAQLQRII